MQPTSYNVAVALTAAILYSDLTQNLGGVYTNTNPDAYPISAYSYFIAQCVPAQAAAQNFSCDSAGQHHDEHRPRRGARSVHRVRGLSGPEPGWPNLGYSPIPANLVEDDFQAAGRLPGRDHPARPDARTATTPTSRER